MTQSKIQKIFVLAGLSNIFGVLIFSRLFTNQTLMTLQSTIMGAFGLVSIILWGLAYIAVHKRYNDVLALIGVFCVEKLVYVIAWISFVSRNSLADIYADDKLAGLYFSIYGINDFAFMLFFAYVLLKGRAGR